MKFGAHLPLMDFGGNPYTISHLARYTRRAVELGFETLSANDHLVFASPWLDGPTALASVIGDSGSMTLATTVSLPVVRGPVQVAKAMAAIDRLSGGRAVVAVGAGSSPRDYEIAGVDFGERWKRLDEAVQTMRALWRVDQEPFVGRFYSTEAIELLPKPAQLGGPPIWIGSWGSDAVCAAPRASPTAGWHRPTTPRPPSSRLPGPLSSSSSPTRARTPAPFRTLWRPCGSTSLTTLPMATGSSVNGWHPPSTGPKTSSGSGSLSGPAAAFADKLCAFRDAGVQQVLIWPVTDEVRQLELFCEHVLPLVTT